jgi:transposase
MTFAPWHHGVFSVFQEANTMQAQMPDRFYEFAKKHLPKEKPIGKKGGRPPICHRIILNVIWFVEVTGCRWKDVPTQMGCSGESARTRLRDWEEVGIWDAIHLELLGLLRKLGVLDPSIVIIDSTQTRAVGGGDETGPSPVDRRKKGTKFTLIVDAHGVPMVIRLAPSNQSDHIELIPAVQAIPKVGGLPGRPITHPDDLYGDAGYDSERRRIILRFLGIEPHIRYKNSEHGSHLGTVRWVVERTISWIKGLRRMRIRYDRSGTIVNAFATLAAAMVCFQMAQAA